jgi:hypothetical protein
VQWDLKKAYDSVRKEVLYSIPSEFGVTVKCERRRQLRSPRCSWEDNIKMDLRKLGFGCMDWILLGQDRDR